MTPQEFADKMREIAARADLATGDPIQAHQDADALMCELLSSLGYYSGVLVFQEMDKYYA